VSAPDPGIAFLRHALATLAYRGGKAVAGVPPGFAEFRAGPTTRTPVEILAHVGDLLAWTEWMVQGQQVWSNATPAPWLEEVARFFARLESLDRLLAAATTLGRPVEVLFQGPIADALTHVGQINLLRRLADAPVGGENYAKADIQAGRVGLDQAEPRVEFE